MGQPATRRILLALASPDPAAGLLEAIATLVGASQAAELRTLFIEDANLLRLAGLPFAREVGLVSAVDRLLSTEQVERALRTQASRAERLLAEVFGKSGTPFSFQVVRGTVLAVAMECAPEADVLVLGDAGAQRLPSPRENGHRAGLPARTPRKRNGGASLLLLLVDDSPAAGRALQLAAELAQLSAISVRVVLLADDDATFASLRDWVIVNLPLPAGQLRCDRRLGRDLHGLAHLLSNAHPVALIVPGLPDAGGLRTLLDAWGRGHCFLFLVR